MSRVVAFGFVFCFVVFCYVLFFLRVAVYAVVFLRVGGRVGVCFAFAASVGVLRSGVCWCVVFVGGGGEGGRLGGV